MRKYFSKGEMRGHTVINVQLCATPKTGIRQCDTKLVMLEGRSFSEEVPHSHELSRLFSFDKVMMLFDQGKHVSRLDIQGPRKLPYEGTSSSRS